MNHNRFKFRVWDNLNRRYCKDLPYLDKDGDLCYEDGHKYCNGEHPEDFTVEQCTGFRDRNGKLIYEGCIVRGLDMWGNYHLFTVYWYQGKFVLCKDRWSAPVLVWDSLSYEIVGNIHEVQHE